MLVAAVAGYGRRAYADCVNSGGSTYLCSGATVTQQTINANNASVSTAAGFSVNTPDSRGISITGDGGLSYTDTNASPVTAAQYGLYLSANHNNGGTPGSITVNTNGAISGAEGLFAIARSYSTGGVNITVNGNVSGTTRYGILTRAYGGGVSLTTGVGTTVSTVSGNSAIYAGNSGSGTGGVTIIINGDVTNTNNTGLQANNAGAGGLSLTTAAGTTVSGGGYGISAGNSAGAATITINGDVTGTTGSGISAGNSGTTLSITTAAGTTVSGGNYGIYAVNNGTGALTIAVNGTVTGNIGIYARRSAATVTVSGTVTGSGGTAIEFDQSTAFANRLELVTGAVINGNVLGGPGTDTLGLSGTSSGSFNVAQLSSFEAGDKTGSGTWTLTGTNAGITAFSVSAGKLLVNGSLSNAGFTVSGGTLGGAGTVGNTSMTGGTFQPGSGTPGTFMTVNGTLSFNAASTYAVNVNPLTSSFANVSGAATLGGATVNAIFANGSYVAKQYTILNAASFSGAFATTVTNTNLPANFTDTLTYDSTHAYLNLILSFSTPAPGGLNGNQNNVANALINYFNTNGSIPLAFGGLTANGLSQASGQPGASTAQGGIGGVGQFANAIFDAAFDDNGGQGGATGFAEENAYATKAKVSRQATEAYAAVTPRDRMVPAFVSRWNVWATAYGGNSRVNGDATAGTSTTTSRIFGTAVGATYRFTPDTQLGFALGGAGSSFDLDGGFGSGRADVFNAAAYAKHTIGSAYVAGLLGYSWQDTTTDRTVTISGTDQLHAAFKAQALAARLEGGWRYATPAVGITPYAALQATSFFLPSYGESATSGNNTFALSYASQTVTATRSEFGAKFDRAMLVRDGVFTLKAKTAWAHDWNTDRSATATFQTLPGATFTVNGAQPSADAALVSFGGEMAWHNGWSLAGSFDGEFSRTTASYAGKGSVKYVW
jgi:uncharacterized protein with beta-barrel porin domain